MGGFFEAPVLSTIVVVSNTPIVNDFQSSIFIFIYVFYYILTLESRQKQKKEGVGEITVGVLR